MHEKSFRNQTRFGAETFLILCMFYGKSFDQRKSLYSDDIPIVRLGVSNPIFVGFIKKNQLIIKMMFNIRSCIFEKLNCIVSGLNNFYLNMSRRVEKKLF